LVDNETRHDHFMGLIERLDRIADALEQIVLNMEKPKLTTQDYRDHLEALR